MTQVVAIDDVILRRDLLEAFDRLLLTVYEKTGRQLVVSIGVAPGVLVHGGEALLVTPCGVVRLFEDR